MSQQPRGYKIILKQPSDAAYFLKNVLKLQDTFAKDYITTIGASIYKRELILENNIPVRMIIWDLAESSQFARVRKSYLANAEGAILIFNLWDPSSLEQVTSLYPDIIKASPDIKIVVIGRLSRSPDKHPLSSLRKEAEHFANDIAGKYVELRPQDARIAEQAFKFLCQGFMERFDEYIQKENQRQEELRNMLRRILHVSKKISITQVQKLLGLDLEEFKINLLAWAEQLGFKIDGDYLILDSNSTTQFIEYLEAQFTEWEQNQREKFEKI